MKEIDLRSRDLPRNDPTNWSERLRPDMSREPVIEDIIQRVNNGENVFVKFSDKDPKRPGAIAKIKKIEGIPAKYDSYHNIPSRYTFHLKWNGRTNSTKVAVNYCCPVWYLPDYDGDTVWSWFDAKQYAEQHAEPVYDRLGHELSVDDTVVYINARYGSGAMLDLGTIKEIKQRGKKDHRGNITVAVEVIIETIATEDDEPIMESRIKKSENSILKLTDIDLFDEAFVRKLTVTPR